MPRALTSLAGSLVSNVAQSSVVTTLAGVLISEGIPKSRWAQTDFVGVLGSIIMANQNVETSIAGVLVSYTESPPDVFTQRCSGMTFDNHPFYVMHLGKQGTFVYDLDTKQWSQWQTAGFDTWNMESITVWNNYTVGGSLNTGNVWKLDPLAVVDENFRTIERIVTGGYPMRGRRSLENYGVRLVASVGQADDVDSTIKLEISDDNGQTFLDVGTIDLDTTKLTQELAWTSLGKINTPGRVFKFTDVGGLKRIDDADVDMEKSNEKPANG